MANASPAWIRIARSHGSALIQPLVEAVVTMLAVLATLFCTLKIAPGGGPAVLAVVLSLSLSRSHMDRDLRGRLEAAVVLPLVGFVVMGVGLLLRHTPWVGALAFVAGMFLSIWLRRFGSMARRAGRLIALPFVTLLTLPHIRASSNGVLPSVLVPIVVALLSLMWVTVFHLLARRLRLLPPVRALEHPPVAPAQEGGMRPVASTRMAIQMAVALALSFVVGYLCLQGALGVDRVDGLHRQQRQSRTIGCGVQERTAHRGRRSGHGVGDVVDDTHRRESSDHGRADSCRAVLRRLAAPAGLCMVGVVRHAGAGAAAGLRAAAAEHAVVAAARRNRDWCGDWPGLGVVGAAGALQRCAAPTLGRCAGGHGRSDRPGHHRAPARARRQDAGRTGRHGRALPRRAANHPTLPRRCNRPTGWTRCWPAARR